MARTIAEIQQQIIDAKNAEADLAGLTSDSHRAIWRLWTFVIATAIAIHEQLLDLYLSALEAVVAKSAAASTLWVQAKMFAFQYDATTPQVAVLTDLTIEYPVVDATKRIITACSVTTDINNVVRIKVAKGSPFEALSTNEKDAAQAYINMIGAAGITYTLTSDSPDKIYIAAEIFYQGQYSAVIQQAVIDGINSYLQGLSVVNFNGSLKMTDLEAVIRNVPGVNDVIMQDVIGRADSPTPADPTANPNGVYYIQNTATAQRLFNPAAGYIVEETVTGYTFADSLTFTAQ